MRRDRSGLPRQALAATAARVYPILADSGQSLSFLTSAAFRFYLPGYLLAAVRHYRDADLIPMIIVHSLTAPAVRESNDMRRFLRLADQFTPAQGAAILAFLNHMEEWAATGVVSSFSAEEPRIAAERFWSRHG